MTAIPIASAVVSAIVSVVLVILAVRWFIQGLRGRGRAAIAKRFPASEVLLTETLAQSFGEQSRGATQLRGSGALALTSTELWFQMYVPTRELRIPLPSIRAVSMVRSHLGKSQFTDLLHVRFLREDGKEDAIAWRVPNPGEWKARIDSTIG